MCVCVSLSRATLAGGGGDQMKRMYSAVPGRVYVATRAHSATGDRELSLSKGDKVKGETKNEERRNEAAFGTKLYYI